MFENWSQTKAGAHHVMRSLYKHLKIELCWTLMQDAASFIDLYIFILQDYYFTFYFTLKFVYEKWHFWKELFEIVFWFFFPFYRN